MTLTPVEIICKKRDREKLSEKEIEYFVSAYTNGDIPDYQASAWLMAIVLNGMDLEETYWLTKTMLNSGKTMDFSHLKIPVVDKHSTGGVGDKTTMILAPLVAACDVAVPTIAGRGLGHTGGTLDKLESIPGFQTRIDQNLFSKIMKEHNLCFMGQTEQICPADKKMYALRDVTGTVESIPLICASIMGKKLAEGIDGLVLDVKCGGGAFMKTLENAENLAQQLKNIGKQAGKKVHVLITDMDQPLGRFVGNSVEIDECVSILKNETTVAKDTRDLSLELAAHMLWVAKRTSDLAAAKKLAESTLKSGKAFEKFEAVVKAQGGDLSKLPKPRHRKDILATKSGFIEFMDTEAIGISAILLRAGRQKITDTIEPTAGIEFHKKVGDEVKSGEILVTLFGQDPQLFNSAEQRLLGAIQVGAKPQQVTSLVLKTLI